MLSADGRPLRAGQTIYVADHGRVVEHVIARFAGEHSIFFEQPEMGGAVGCRNDVAYVFHAAAECALDLVSA